jgi:hypothetical protein
VVCNNDGVERCQPVPIKNVTRCSKLQFRLYISPPRFQRLQQEIERRIDQGRHANASGTPHLTCGRPVAPARPRTSDCELPTTRLRAAAVCATLAGMSDRVCSHLWCQQCTADQQHDDHDVAAATTPDGALGSTT